MTFENETLACDQAQPLGTSPAKRNASQIFYGCGPLASAFDLLGRTHHCLFLQRVLQTSDAGVPRWSSCGFAGFHSEAHCCRTLCRSHRLADRSLRSPPRDSDRYRNFWFYLVCESDLFRKHRSVLLLCPFRVWVWSYPLCGSLISHWFNNSRGLALGLTMLARTRGCDHTINAQTLIARFAQG